ncbi:aromatic-L-amino-acid decarboxylase [Aulographum hederae CBS 113979]|uniref:Aromatic-L-amino-acid decarboxylase n=1 Tax=Aulographum hederae CBS 113979 TaxID=1176131 RepID=A0A6G1GQ89_9PEZI|nr:aromatic-L-amino-acid decarboxylase [Aulographum hederae CBS 113979]
MNADEFRKAAHAAVEEIIHYNETLPTVPVTAQIPPGYLSPHLPSTAPQHPQPWSTIQPDIATHIIPGLTHWQHPGFMSWFPATTSYPSLLGEMYSAAFTAPAFNWLCSPACTELETVVMDWVCRMLALPDVFLSGGEGGGVIQGSASEAIVTCMVAARERMVVKECKGLEGEEREKKVAEVKGRLVALGGDQVHSATPKGAMIAGTRYHAITTRREDGFRLTGKGLREALKEIEGKGLLPYYVTTTMGSTGICAVDVFEEIAEVKKEWPDVWIHVDAAYAGAALVCEEYQHHAKFFGEFDSFDMNMHKWLLVNFDASCLFVRKRQDLISAMSITPSYLLNPSHISGLVTDYRDWQIPLGRRFRALKIWFVLRSYGVSGLQKHIRHTVGLGELFAGLVRERSDLFRIVAGPAFALTVIQVLPKKGEKGNDGDEAWVQEVNRVTKEAYEAVNRGGEIFLTSGVVGGQLAIRVVSANANAEEKWVKKAFEILVKEAEKVVGTS